jgi:hypothetical protein
MRVNETPAVGSISQPAPVTMRSPKLTATPPDPPLKAERALQDGAVVDGEGAGELTGHDQRSRRHLGCADRRGPAQRPYARALRGQSVEVDEVVVRLAGALQHHGVGGAGRRAADSVTGERGTGLQGEGVCAGAGEQH